jgi:hypothetical protein
MSEDREEISRLLVPKWIMMPLEVSYTYIYYKEQHDYLY